MKKLYVRVQLKQAIERFFRCGIEFTKAWKPVDVDDATAARLEAEQMLEVSETIPADYEETEAGDSAPGTPLPLPIVPAPRRLHRITAVRRRFKPKQIPATARKLSAPPSPSWTRKTQPSGRLAARPRPKPSPPLPAGRCLLPSVMLPWKTGINNGLRLPL